MTSFLSTEREGDKSTLLVGHLTGTASSRWSRRTSTVLSYVDTYVPFLWYDDNALSLCGLPPQNSSPSLIMRKPAKLRREGHLTSPQNYQGHQTPEKSEKLSQPRGAQGDITMTGMVISWIGSWKRKRKTVSKN